MNGLRITSLGDSTNTEIFYNDKKLECVKVLKIECHPGGPMMATLECYVDMLDVNLLEQFKIEAVERVIEIVPVKE